MTLIEVLLVLLMIAIAAAMILPAPHRPQRSDRISCMSNIKQIDLGFIMYAADNHGKFAIQTSVTNGGTMEFLEHNQTFPHYQKLSPYNLNTRLLVCPSDKDRHVPDSYKNLSDTNLSYFLSADVSTNAPFTSIMAGDRNLEANGKAVRHGTVTLEKNMNLSWTPEMHRLAGVLGFADGHAEICRATNMNAVVQRQGLASVRLSIP
jgi:hypothetical protein